MFNIVLVHPRIPQNTGSIGRMCFNAGLNFILLNQLFLIFHKRLLEGQDLITGIN